MKSFNQKGITLLEAVIASVILLIFVASFYSAFMGSRKFERKTQSFSHAYSVAGNILENFYRFEGTGIRQTGEAVTFENDDSSSSFFLSGTEFDISNLDALDDYFVNVTDEVQFIGEELPEADVLQAKKILKDADIKYKVIDYTGNQNNNTYCPSSGPGAKDGFRSIKIKVSWDDKLFTQAAAAK